MTISSTPEPAPTTTDPVGSATPADVGAKGLAVGKLGVLGGGIIGVACVAPAYSLSSSLGAAVGEVGYQVPGTLLVSLVPMLLVLAAYRELNTAMPDSGTSFTWSTRAFGPWVGWMTGWGLIASTAIVLSSLAGVATDALFALLGQLTGNDGLAELSSNLLINIPVTAVFTVAAAWVGFRGVEATERLQYALVALQVVALGWFAVAAFTAVGSGTAPDPTPVSLSWFDPFAVGDSATLLAGVSLGVFLYWGWDTVVTMNEETRDPERTPVRAAGLAVALTLVIYLLVTVAALSYAGIGGTGDGLTNPDTQDSVLAALSSSVMGPAGPLMALAILASALASLQSTMTSPSRTLLAMGWFEAVPDRFRQVHPRFRTPVAGIAASAGFAIVFYAVMRVISPSALEDTISALGMLISFYYAITALAAVRYFRRTLFSSARAIAFRLVLPLLGGLALLALFVVSAIDASDPSYGSGSSLGGLGTVFVAGIGSLVVGLVLMLLQAWRSPAFFRGRTLPCAAAPAEG